MDLSSVEPSSIKYILFDLDNTLYSASWGLEEAVNRRVNEYLARRFGLPPEEAWARRKERVLACGYGTTLEWLRAEEGMDDAETERFLAFIHPEDDAGPLSADRRLRALLLSLAASFPLGILTNASLEHALRILRKLEVEDLFPVIFDIRRNGLKGKPDRAVYRAILAELALPAAACLLVDDVPRYIEGYRALGGAGVHYDEEDKRPDFPGPRIRRLEELRALIGG
ncbi:MAG: HAD-IA family hydrolase [Treponema sp.]|jgi:putative hydrolase of the HAD superfamily|nr:HAD-IA family hydrolase [Treponema sp.]